MELVQATRAHLRGYVAALRSGWSADNVRGAAAAEEELTRIEADPDAFLASLYDPDARGPPITMPDGSMVRRIPGYRKWMWDGEFCGSIGLRFGGNEVDFRAFRGRSWNGIDQELTEKEAMILKVLAERPGEIVSREDLLERVWGYDVFPSTRTVDNFILRLRKRFERDPANPQHFLTVWGVGYRFLLDGQQ